jgi:hypothetical protein
MALISLDEAKEYLRVDSSDEDALTASLLSAASNLCVDVARLTDEQWEDIETDNEDPFETPAYTGSRLKLPYNIDVSDDHDNDVELVEYIGRSHPVSYYGTQRGETATWNVEIDKNDEETLLGIRRLAIYMGDVYVREPSGSGYWANVSVSYSQKHNDLTIPVTFKIARVEGGM